MESKKVKSLLKTTVFYTIIIGGLLYLQFYQRITIPIKLRDETIQFDPTFLFLPLLSLLTFNYASKIIKSTIIGKLGPALSSGLNRLGLATFLWIFTIQPGFPQYLKPFSGFILVLASISVVNSVISTILKEKNQFVIGTIVNSVTILFVGYYTNVLFKQINQLLIDYQVFTLEALAGRTSEQVLLGLFYQGLIDIIDESVLISSSVVALFSFFGIFRANQNPYLNYIGKRLSQGLFSKFIGIFTLFVYVFFARGFFLTQTGLNPQLISVTEWSIICIISYIIYRRTRGFVSDSLTVSEQIGYWTKHIQEIERRSSIKMDNLARLVELFLRAGEKDDLVVTLVDTFRKFNVPVSNISPLISEIVNHNDLEIGLLTFNWQKNMLNNINLERRRDALYKVLDSIQVLSSRMSYRALNPDYVTSRSQMKREVATNED